MTIVLLHGAFPGPWCWDLLTPLLEGLGHSVVAADMPVADPAAGASAYADAVMDAIHGWDAPPVVVAHSLSGLVAPLVAARRPVARVIYLAAILPVPGMSADEQRAVRPWVTYVPSTLQVTDLGEDTMALGPDTATELFFHDLPPDLATWAVARLRPQCYRILHEVTPLVAWPDAPVSWIVCRDDRAVDADWGRDTAHARLGIAPVEIDGGHSPFLTRPTELGHTIDALVRAG